MDYCVHCGAKRKVQGRRPHYDCPAGCGRQTIKVSSNCQELARAFYKADFDLKRITSSVTKVPAAGAEVMLVTVEFNIQYPAIMFSKLPDSWHYAMQTIDLITAKREAVELIYHDNFFSLGFYPTPAAEMRVVINKLHDWLKEQQNSGRWAVYKLAGYLPAGYHP